MQKSPLNIPLMHPLPDIQHRSLFVQFNWAFQICYLFLLQKGSQPHTSYVLSLLSTHTFQNWENTYPWPPLAGEPFLQIGLSLPQL